MKGKLLEFRRPTTEAEANQALAQYALKALRHERAVSNGVLQRGERMIAEANLRRELLSIGEQFGL